MGLMRLMRLMRLMGPMELMMPGTRTLSGRETNAAAEAAPGAAVAALVAAVAGEGEGEGEAGGEVTWLLVTWLLVTWLLVPQPPPRPSAGPPLQRPRGRRWWGLMAMDCGAFWGVLCGGSPPPTSWTS